MKKLLIMLMVVAMAFLFVGCLGTTPPIDPDDPVEPVVPVTQAPIITSISDVSFTSALAQYTNKIEVGGVAPAGSVIKIYVNGVNTGIGYSGTNASFEEVSGTSIAKVLDGAKTLYATATQFGLAESAASASYSFTYDTTAPTIAKAVVTDGELYITVAFNEAVKATEKYDGIDEDKKAAWAMSALNPINWNIVFGDASFTADSATATYLAVSDKVIMITEATPLTTPIAGGDWFTISCTNIGDSLGNHSATATTYLGVVPKVSE
ncbi:hypothetical protein ES695_17765 [Candidatus Atribacteria bacterium 1244-E10-H5-B2]|nr:MAG: hypothetical protein ES695_17765 [Candidatus Atribacteria bacterium 1244-E10-H5-B2]